MQKWLENILKILRNPQYKQIKGRWVEFNENGEPIGKCAMGEISCQSGLKIQDSCYHSMHSDILKIVGVPKWLIHGGNLPILERSNGKIQKLLFYEESSCGINLDDYIIYTNDFGWTYNEIADFLETTFKDL